MAKQKPTDAKANQHKQEELEQLQTQLTVMEGNWKRALADYHNLEKRTGDQRVIMAQLGCLALLERLLPVIDHLELAAKHLHDAGLDMVVKHMREALAAEGIVPIESAWQTFDPQTMECVEKVSGDKDVVVEVVADGWKLMERLIRPAKVKVGDGTPA
jgi:molecular chaperone GrpE